MSTIYVKNIVAALCSADNDDCTDYRANGAAYLAKLTALDSSIKSGVAAIPAEKRKVITTHDAFGYFAHEYGVTFLAPQGVSTESEASAGDVARLIDQIRNEGVRALFVENISDPRLIQQIAAETGIAPGGELYSDALSEPERSCRDLHRDDAAQCQPAAECDARQLKARAAMRFAEPTFAAAALRRAGRHSASRPSRRRAP